MATQQHRYSVVEQVTKNVARIRYVTFHYPADQIVVAWEVGDDTGGTFVTHTEGSVTLKLSDFPNVKLDADSMAAKALTYLAANGYIAAGVQEDVPAP